jgi:hypothetical protein
MSEVNEILERYSKLGTIGKREILEKIPEKERRYKCYTCHKIVNSTPCPNCGETHIVVMCPLDHCHCTHSIVGGIEYCPLCGDPVCPGGCLSHDIFQLSRVTGYLQDVSGWNAGKQQELKDRHKVDIE